MFSKHYYSVVCCFTTFPRRWITRTSRKMVRHARLLATDALLGKESLAVLSSMGFGDSKPRLQPHQYHGVVARSRKRPDTLGKKDITSTVQQRQQYHKERVTINQANDIADITRNIYTFAKDGRRVPMAVWDKYDRINKLHNKHEHMLAIAAKMRDVEKKRWRNRLAAATTNGADACGSLDDDVALSVGPKLCGKIRPRSSHQQQAKPTRSREGCRGVMDRRTTFGCGRESNERKEALRLSVTAHLSRSRSCPPSYWGRYEREKLNELYWELGRPPRKGFGAAREHFHRYTQRHCMLFPHRSPKEVVERLKVMMRYNALKEPKEKEYWLKHGVSKGHFPKPDAKNDRAALKKHCNRLVGKNTATSTADNMPPIAFHGPKRVDPQSLPDTAQRRMPHDF